MRRFFTSKIFMYIRLCIYIGILMLLIVLPVAFVEGRSFCIFYNLLHIKCPGCGMTRAFFNISHGNVAKAIEYNWFVIVIFPIFVLVTMNDAIIIIRRLLFGMKFDVDSGGNLSIFEKILFRIYSYPEQN